jgi:hypothetical protein
MMIGFFFGYDLAGEGISPVRAGLYNTFTSYGSINFSCFTMNPLALITFPNLQLLRRYPW